MKKSLLVILGLLSFLHFEDIKSGIFESSGNVEELSENSKTIRTQIDKSNFIKTADFDSIYKNLPETGTTTRDFAYLTADPEFQKVFRSHFEKIKLINCRNFHEQKHSDQTKCVPELFTTEFFSGPVALKLAQSGKKVTVLIFADSTNVGGIYLTKRGNPAGTQEEQTVLMTPEIYGYLGNNFGIHDIGGNGDGIYSAKQKRYCMNKNDYENPKTINPAYGFILTNLLMTHDIEHSSKMIKLPKDEVVEVSYAFLSMPSFATDVSKDPTGTMLINQYGEQNGEEIYDRMKQALYILQRDKGIYGPEVIRDVGKIAIFYPAEKLKKFSQQYLSKNISTGEAIADIVEMKSEQPEKLEKVTIIFEEAQRNYEKCVSDKFIKLIRGAEIAGSDTLVLGKIGCGAFLNNENEVASLLGRALSECKSIKYVYFAGLNKTDPFIEKVRNAIKK